MTNEALDLWAPSSCTLAIIERPLRLAEFDTAFARWLIAVVRNGSLGSSLIFVDEPGTAAALRDLAARESACCSSFTFAVWETPDSVGLDVQVPEHHTHVLAALTARAESFLGRAA